MENIKEFEQPISIDVEKEKKPKYRLMITRHAERLPSGALTPEGIASADKKGLSMKDTAEVLKAYASDHKSKRAYDTGDRISQASGIKSPKTEKQYRTKEVPDIQYDILKPDLYYLIPEGKRKIEEATLRDLGWSTETDEKGNFKIDIEKLPLEKQREIAPTRQKYQKLGFEFFLQQPEGVHRLAIGLAHQLLHELEILKRYKSLREHADNPPKKDVIINTATHGLLTESLLMEAGIYKKPDGKEIQGITDFTGDEFGGYMQPTESWYMDIDDPANPPEKIPVIFEGENRPKPGTVFIELGKLKQLNGDYIEWKKSLEKN